MKRWVQKFMLLCLALFVVALAGCAADGQNDSEATNEEQENEAVATVNGEDISQAEVDSLVERIWSSYEQQGLSPDSEEGQQMLEQVEQDVIDDLINQTLLLQKANEFGLEASQEEVDAEISQISSQFESDEQWEMALEQSNFTEEELADQLHNQIVIGKLMEQEADEIEIDDNEAKEYYDQVASEATGEEELPAFEDVKDQIKDMLKQEQQQGFLEQYIQDLRDASDIQMHV